MATSIWKQHRNEDAKERQKDRAERTVEEQIKLISERPGASAREMAKLTGLPADAFKLPRAA